MVRVAEGRQSGWVPATFTRDLCGYRLNNLKPNMSDSHDELSVRLGTAFLQVLGVPDGETRPGQDGSPLENSVIDRLRLARPDLVIERSRAASSFTQYRHLDVFPAFRAGYDRSRTALECLQEAIREVSDQGERARLTVLAGRVAEGIEGNARLVEDMTGQMPEESLLKIDVTVGVPNGDTGLDMAVALSAKWSLRTDRAQDCVSQGNKLVAQRRGRMPHFAVITVETRPSMLKILADGSGAIDCVYHLDLGALARAIDVEAQQQRNPLTWSPKRTLDRLLKQRRLRDFDDLVALVEELPAAR